MSSISMWSSRLTRRKGQWVVDEGLLRSLVPLNLLDGAELRRLIGHTQILKVPAGGDIGRSRKAQHTIYLLSGIVEILSDQGVNAVVAAGTEASRQPLLSAKSVAVSARAKTDATILKLSVDTEDLMFHGGYAADYEVSDIGSATATDWLTRFLQAKVFTRLPPSNIRQLLSRMEEVEAGAGQVIMRQDEADDYYYIVKEGVCRVTTRPASGAGEIHLADLREGDGFGEDALITNGRRGATVTMVDDGRLMRLAKEDFTALLVEPVLKYVTWDQAQGLLKGGAVLLDVRRPEESVGAAVVNIPLRLLRSKAHELDPDRVHITVSNVLNRSSAAAFLLCQQGMDVCILKDGAGVLGAAPRAHALLAREAPAPSRDATEAAPPAPISIRRDHGTATASAAASTRRSPSRRLQLVVPPAPPATAAPVVQRPPSRLETVAAGTVAPVRAMHPPVKRVPKAIVHEAGAADRTGAGEQEVQRLRGQLAKSRLRLKKVVTMARTLEARRREVQAHAHRLEERHATLTLEVGNWERRLAESESLRRKLERTVAVLRAQRTAPRPVAGDEGPIRALPPPRDRSAGGREVRRVVRYGAWGLFVFIALLGAISVSRYDSAMERPPPTQADRGPGGPARAAPRAPVPLSAAAGRRHRGTEAGHPAVVRPRAPQAGGGS